MTFYTRVFFMYCGFFYLPKVFEDEDKFQSWQILYIGVRSCSNQVRILATSLHLRYIPSVPSLIGKVRLLEAQLKIARRALWHYSKYLSWNSCSRGDRCHFNLEENKQGGNITEADQIAREAERQIVNSKTKSTRLLQNIKLTRKNES